MLTTIGAKNCGLILTSEKIEDKIESQRIVLFVSGTRLDICGELSDYQDICFLFLSCHPSPRYLKC